MTSNLIIFIFMISSLHALAYSTTNEYNSSSGNSIKTFGTTQDSSLKYILLWTTSDHDPFVFIGFGRQGFIDRNCLYTNCYVTNIMSYLGDYTKFDAILFYGPDVRDYSKGMLPSLRSPSQKYVFVSDKPSENYPLRSDYFDGFFNWTWTYKLDSDLRWGHIVVTDVDKNIIGPNKTMRWIKTANMAPVNLEMRDILREKKKAVVWMPTDCSAANYRIEQVKKLQTVLKAQYGLNLDIYGECSDLKCIRGDTYAEDDDECGALIRNDYYFYIAYEECLSEDYVTVEILPALRHNAVPIVYGGANYTRFLPEGSYLNAYELTTDSLALEINKLIRNHSMYIQYFKWTNHYRYYSTLEHEDSNQYCKMCALLNDRNKVNQTSEYKDFRSWWNPDRFRALTDKDYKPVQIIHKPINKEDSDEPDGLFENAKYVFHEVIGRKVLNAVKFVVQNSYLDKFLP